MKHELSKSGTDQSELSASEILATYQSLGLTTASDRARFDAFQEKRPQLQFDVVISDTSQPFTPA